MIPIDSLRPELQYSSDINTMQSSVTEFDVENCEDALKDSFTTNSAMSHGLKDMKVQVLMKHSHYVLSDS